MNETIDGSTPTFTPKELFDACALLCPAIFCAIVAGQTGGGSTMYYVGRMVTESVDNAVQIAPVLLGNCPAASKDIWGVALVTMKSDGTNASIRLAVKQHIPALLGCCPGAQKCPLIQ